MASGTYVPSPTNCEMYQRGRSMHFNPPSGRSFWGCAGELDVTPCPACEGEGHHDSCFDCGNRGYTTLDEEGELR